MKRSNVTNVRGRICISRPSGLFPIRKFGGRSLIAVADIERLLNQPVPAVAAE
jgi:hypothetical protein